MDKATKKTTLLLHLHLILCRLKYINHYKSDIYECNKKGRHIYCCFAVFRFM